MANGGNYLVSAINSIGKLDVLWIFGKIDHWTMSSDVEDCVVVVWVDLREALCVGKFLFDDIVAKESYAFVVGERLQRFNRNRPNNL